MSPATLRTSIRNLLANTETVSAPVKPVAGDIVRDADGSLCAIERVGWCGGMSPMLNADGTPYDVLQAYIFGFNEDGSVWTDWTDLHTLSTEDVDAADESRFCDYVLADLVSLRKSFRVVNDAVLMCECCE